MFKLVGTGTSDDTNHKRRLKVSML